jgi:predicted RNase H-like HicB family nuclease
MTEIIFLVEADPEGGYVARAISQSIFTQAETLAELREMIHDAVQCHFDNTCARKKPGFRLISSQTAQNYG